jgi:hypothetical protein
MSLHFSNGRVLLKNTTDSEWYYLSATVDDDDVLPHINVNQVSQGDLSLEEFDEYVILRSADDGNLYKLGLETNGDGEVTYTFFAATLPVSYRPVRLYVKDQSTGLTYEIKATMDPFLGQVRPEVVVYSVASNTRTIDKSQRCMAPVSVVTPACMVPASATDEGDIIVGPTRSLPRSAILIDEGGGAIGGEGGGGMVSE